MRTFLSWYMDGECERVWGELVALGPAVREEPLASEAHAVARETMRRAAGNVNRIIGRLHNIGYRFEHSRGGKWVPNAVIHTPPSPDTAQRIVEIEATTGSLPLSLRAWYEVVGIVDLTGRHPEWDSRALSDPLVVEGIEGWRFEYEDWLYTRQQRPESDGPFYFPIAPDAYHKANISGGQPYCISLPCEAADGPLLWFWHEETTFVEYLRICFQWGGFPGWASTEGQWDLPSDWAPYSVRPKEHLAYLSTDLLPI